MSGNPPVPPDHLDQLKLNKGISFNTYAKQLPALEIAENAENQQSDVGQENIGSNNNQKYCNFDEIISKVRKDHLSKQNLFEQIMQNRGDEIYQLTKFTAQTGNENNKDGQQTKNLQEKNEQSNLQQSTSAANNNHQNIQEIEQKPQQIEESKIEITTEDPTKQEQTENRISCNCKKSHCIKLYCECFNRGLMCNDQCKCSDCKNRPQFQAKREKAIQYLLQKNQIQAEGSTNNKTNNNQISNNNTNELNEIFGKPREGCNCSKSHCVKKYCECYNQGRKCTDKCKCVSCKNGGPNCFTEDDSKNLLEKQADIYSEGVAYNLRKKVKKSEEML